MHTSESDRVPGRRPARLAVVAPASGETFDAAPDQQPDEVDAVVDRAHLAWHGRRADPAARTTALRAAADAVERAGDDLARLLTRVKNSGVGVAGGPWGFYGNLRPFVVHRPQEA